MTERELRMIDIHNPEGEVEIVISTAGDRIWVNVDGICRLRIGGTHPDDLRIENYYAAATKSEPLCKCDEPDDEGDGQCKLCGRAIPGGRHAASHPA